MLSMFDSVAVKRWRLSGCSNTSSSSSSSTGLKLDDLTDDVLIVILLKLPVKLLHRCKRVSKRWFSLISMPSFARSYIITHHTSNSDLVLFEYIRDGVQQVYAVPLVDHVMLFDPLSSPLLYSFDFIPALRRDNYTYHHALCPPGVSVRMLSRVHLMGTCGGLLLLKAEFQDATDTSPYYDNPPYGVYYVCNPLSKDWVQLPTLPNVYAYVGFTSYYLCLEKDGQKTRVWADGGSSEELLNHMANYNPNNIEFTVLYVTKDRKHNVFGIFVFHSSCESACWHEFRVPFPDGYSCPKDIQKPDIVFLNGVFFWPGIDSIVAYDPFNKPHRCDIIPQPPLNYPEVNHPVLMKFIATTGEGSLRMGRDFGSGRFVVWELVDYANKNWALKCDFKLKDKGLRYFDVWFQSFTGAAGDKVYLVDDTKKYIMLFDLKTRSIQPVYSLPSVVDCFQSFYNVKPYKLSLWPTRVLLRHEA